MGRLHELRSQLLRDRRITSDEVGLIRDYIIEDGKLDLDDVKFLVELLGDAQEVCSEFDELFFPVLKEAILADEKIGQDEMFYLLKMLYSDGHVRDSEKQFLCELRDEAVEVTPQFESLFETAMQSPVKNWSVGGR